MNPEREHYCEGCVGCGHGCRQPCYPITKEEWEKLGAKPDDHLNPETVEKMIHISTKPECAETLLKRHSPEEWAELMLIGGIKQ